MLQLTPQSRVFLAIEPHDFRKGIDGLAQVCRQSLNQDPFSGAIFVFRNRAKTAIKILTYDGQGYWLMMKRLSKGKLKWWPNGSTITHTMTHRELQILLWNGNPKTASLDEDWKQVN